MYIVSLLYPVWDPLFGIRTDPVLQRTGGSDGSRSAPSFGSRRSDRWIRGSNSIDLEGAWKDLAEMELACGFWVVELGGRLKPLRNTNPHETGLDEIISGDTTFDWKSRQTSISSRWARLGHRPQHCIPDHPWDCMEYIDPPRKDPWPDR